MKKPLNELHPVLAIELLQRYGKFFGSKKPKLMDTFNKERDLTLSEEERMKKAGEEIANYKGNSPAIACMLIPIKWKVKSIIWPEGMGNI